MDMRHEVLSSVGAQDLHTSIYQVSDLEDIEFNWENSQMDMDAVFRPGLGTPFFPTTFSKTRRMLLLQQHPSLSDPQNLPGCREVALLEQEWTMYPIMFLENCFIKYYCVFVLI